MKIALVHDYIKEYGGAERVLEALHELYPDAPVYTSVYLPEYLGPHEERFKGWDVRESWVKYLPFKAKIISPLRIIAPLLFRSFDFSQFDAVIVSATGAYTPNTIRTKKILKQVQDDTFKVQDDNKRKTIHITYCHTPPRYLYGYATAREWKKNWVIRVIGEIANHFLRLVDFASAQNVDYFIANSKEVQARVKKFYRREATVIYPPVDIGALLGNKNFLVPHSQTARHANSENFVPSQRRKEYFLAGGRLARPKNIDLIVKACQELKVPLKVFGRGFAGSHDSLFMIHNSNIEFVGEVSDEEKLNLMKNAKAYIFASEDEDFGITPVEAMNVGTPVIAYRSGGVQESILEGRTGIFFDELTVKSLISALIYFDDSNHRSKIKKEDCINQAKKFSKEHFKTEIQTFIASHFPKS